MEHDMWQWLRQKISCKMEDHETTCNLRTCSYSSNGWNPLSFFWVCTVCDISADKHSIPLLHNPTPVKKTKDSKIKITAWYEHCCQQLWQEKTTCVFLANILVLHAKAEKLSGFTPKIPVQRRRGAAVKARCKPTNVEAKACNLFKFLEYSFKWAVSLFFVSNKIDKDLESWGTQLSKSLSTLWRKSSTQSRRFASKNDAEYQNTLLDHSWINLYVNIQVDWSGGGGGGGGCSMSSKVREAAQWALRCKTQYACSCLFFVVAQGVKTSPSLQ